MAAYSVTPPLENITTPPPRTMPTAMPIDMVKHEMPLLLKCHGIIMSFTWLVLASCGILLARYYKGAWPNSTLCGKPVWFQLHRTLFLFVAVLTLVGVVAAYAYEGPYKSFTEVYDVFMTVHPPCGVTVVVLAIVNPFLALIRPDAKSPRRKLWYFLHWFFGVAAFILANTNIYVAFGHPTGVNPVAYEVMNLLLYCYWVFLFLTLIVLEGHKWWIRRRNTESETCPLKDHWPLQEKDNFQRMMVNDQGATFLKCYLCLFLGITIPSFFAWTLCLLYHDI